MPNRYKVTSSSLFIATVLIVHSSAFQFYKSAGKKKKSAEIKRIYLICARDAYAEMRST